jgi:tetratricopeptide (TPR) repeat protein
LFTRDAPWFRQQQLRMLAQEAGELIEGAGFVAKLDLILAERKVTGPKARRDPRRALPLVETARKLNPESWETYNTLGVTLYRLGRYPEAVAALETSLRHRNSQLVAFDLYFLALCQHRLGAKVKAKEYFESAVRSHEQNDKNLGADKRAELRAFRAEAEALSEEP